MKEDIGQKIIVKIKEALDLAQSRKIYTNANAHELEPDLINIITVLKEASDLLEHYIKNDYTVLYCKRQLAKHQIT